jgi:hypothetical protein
MRADKMIKKEDIRIRDPFIITDKEQGCYYMYGTTGLYNDPEKVFTYSTQPTFAVYKTYDLENFEEPKAVLDGSAQALRGYGYTCFGDFLQREYLLLNNLCTS